MNQIVGSYFITQTIHEEVFTGSVFKMLEQNDLYQFIWWRAL